MMAINDQREETMSRKTCGIKTISGIAGLMMVAMTLTGCAQKMTSNAALEDAKAAYQAAQANPTVIRNAPLELKKAETALSEAEAIFQRKGEIDQVEHQAYLSKQHTAIAQEIANQKMAQAAIEQASAERNKVLLEARATEATLAQQQAAAEKAAAEKAMAEASLAQQQAAAAREKAGQLEEKIAELQAVKADRGLVMTLGDVLFDVDKAELKPGGALVVEKLAVFLQEYPARRVMIEGFTDSTGTAEYNQALSERRALAVRKALLDQGIASTRIDFRGYGEEYPVATNANAAGRQLNRRVEIIISDEAGMIPARTE